MQTHTILLEAIVIYVTSVILDSDFVRILTFKALLELICSEQFFFE